MKHLFALIISTISIVTLKAQKDTLQPFIIKKGIYTTFRDIRSSQPLPDTVFQIIKRKGANSVWIGGSSYKLDDDSLSRNKINALKKILVGVSDGQNFYISDRFTIGGYYGLTKCSLKGPYIYADIEESAAQYTGGGLIPALIKTGKGFVINVNKGLSLPLNKKFLKDLLRQYPDLENEYSKKMSLMDHAVEILQRVNEREVIQAQ